jgi:dTDP-4-amino-4,6-dideoxygalactose transaminase
VPCTTRSARRGSNALHPGAPHPYYRDRYPGLSFPVAEAAYERLLTLPLHAGMTTADVDDVVAALDKVTRAYGTR